MAANNFKPFAIGNGANVTTQADYEALPSLSTGFQAGKASSAQINKALRQSTTMAAVIAQFMADTTSSDVLDNGAQASLVAQFKAALASATAGKLINVQTFNSSGTYTPTLGTKSVIVEVQAGGGGSGGCPATGANSVAASGGGGSGAYAKARITSGLSGVSVTVGAGGAAGASGGGAGGSGGVSSFGSAVICPGGTGGQSTGSTAVSVPASRGGSTDTVAPTGGNMISSRGKAGGGTTIVSTTVGNYGFGSSSVYSGGSPLSNNGDYGSGGGGIANFASQPATAGFAGGNGVVIVWEYA